MERGNYRITAEVEVRAMLGSGNYQLILPCGRMTIVKPGEFEFEPVLGTEPAPGTVVIDRDGDAWQRDRWDEYGWQMSGADDQDDEEETTFNFTWSRLNEKYGPVKVIHTP